MHLYTSKKTSVKDYLTGKYWKYFLVPEEWIDLHVFAIVYLTTTYFVH